MGRFFTTPTPTSQAPVTKIIIEIASQPNPKIFYFSRKSSASVILFNILTFLYPQKGKWKQ